MSDYGRKFYRHSKRFPALKLEDGGIDEVVFGLYDSERVGEMCMIWYAPEKFGTIRPTAKLEVYEDAFESLSKFTDVITSLGPYNKAYIQPREFCALLLENGFTEFE
jgi:hypothetical protein